MTLALKAMLLEYQVLRTEMGRYQNHQVLTMHATWGAAILALAAAALAQPSQIAGLQETVLLGIPILAWANGIFFNDRTLRIRRIAKYLNGSLGTRVSKLASGDHNGSSAESMQCWQWESFKETQASWKAHILDASRWIVFSAVGFPPILIYTGTGRGQTPYLLEAAMLTVNAFLLILFIWTSCGENETSGSRTDGQNKPHAQGGEDNSKNGPAPIPIR